LAYYLFLNSLGFNLVSFFLTAFLFAFYASRRWPAAIGLAVITTGLAYLLFEVLLEGNLPKGLLGF